jgi:hypothetical protein
MTLAKVLAGLCALFLGRQLFSLFVGVVGFALGMEFGPRVYWGVSDFGILASAVALGIIGAALAYLVQDLMIAVVGIVAGSTIAAEFFLMAMPYPGRTLWFALFVGGFAGALLLLALFDWSVIVLSSLFGAGMIVRAVAPDPSVARIAFVVLLAIGIAAQAAFMRRRPPPQRVR